MVTVAALLDRVGRGTDPIRMRDFMQAEAKKWGDIIRQNNFKAN